MKTFQEYQDEALALSDYPRAGDKKTGARVELELESRDMRAGPSTIRDFECAVIVAIDPGIRSPGAAILVDGLVVAAARVKVPKALHEGERGHRAREVGKLIAVQVREWTKQPWGFLFCDLVYEWPQIYRATRSKGNPNDLLKTLATGASAASELGAIVRSVDTPLPAEWAGQTKKATRGDPWDSERGRMVARRLSPAERAVVPDSHDAIDAVALGLWKAGRFAGIRVNFGATPG